MQYYQPVRRDSVLKRCVIAEKKHPLPAFSSEGIRLDVLVITLALALLLFVCVLSADLEAVVRGGKQIGKLNAGIAMLEADNSYLREQISRTASQSFPVRKAADEEPERIVILSPAPME